MREGGKEILARAKLTAQMAGIAAETGLVDTRAGRVCDLVLDHARKWQADLIVIGTHGRRGVRRLLLALAAHGRDEPGISDTLAAQPTQAALASADTFAVGAVLPLLMVLLLPVSALVWGIAGGSLFFLAVLGFLAARAGGHP
jgi:hypothetical protein